MQTNKLLPIRLRKPNSKQHLPYELGLLARSGDHSIQYNYRGMVLPIEQVIAWEKYCPGAADRLLTMTESEQRQTHSVQNATIAIEKRDQEIEAREIEHNCTTAHENFVARTKGTYSVTFLTTLAFALCAYMVHEKVGLASLTPVLGALGVWAGTYIIWGEVKHARAEKQGHRQQSQRAVVEDSTNDPQEKN